MKLPYYGVEPAGRSFKPGDHAATLTYGKPGVIHGFKCYLLQNDKGEPAPVYSIASGLDYPGVGPEHSMLKDKGRVNYVSSDRQRMPGCLFRIEQERRYYPSSGKCARRRVCDMKLATRAASDSRSWSILADAAIKILILWWKSMARSMGLQWVD